MFFRLVMPSVHRHTKGVVVGKWHKTEGDPVDYGDDLVDLEVEITMSAFCVSAEQGIRLVRDSASLHEKDVADLTIDRPMVLVARLTSSDAGILRRIEAKEGTCAEAGSVLAILSTEEDRSADPQGEHLSAASEFRVVANFVE